MPNTPVLISGPNSVCQGESSLSYSIVPIAGANSYLWTVPSGASIISGGVTESIIVDWGTSSGPVTVRAINNCGQSGTKVLNVNINCRLSSAVSPDFSIFPNPASELTTVSFESAADGFSSIQLLDLSGRVVFDKQVATRKGSNQLEINLKSIIKGTYIVKVESISNQSIGRVVIQ
ncbi:MAG: T9SS type A sorting domain-containing protein [Bacteroidetes bacterium]|nr:T9SS type A sorting domain-containing protein [Bacteroidota bacterium]